MAQAESRSNPFYSISQGGGALWIGNGQDSQALAGAGILYRTVRNFLSKWSTFIHKPLGSERFASCLIEIPIIRRRFERIDLMELPIQARRFMVFRVTPPEGTFQRSNRGRSQGRSNRVVYLKICWTDCRESPHGSVMGKHPALGVCHSPGEPLERIQRGFLEKLELYDRGAVVTNIMLRATSHEGGLTFLKKLEMDLDRSARFCKTLVNDNILI